MAPKRKERCQRGHVDWATSPKTGYRFCKTCHTERNRIRERCSPKLNISWADYGRGDKGGRLDTFTRSEVLNARGML